MKLDLQEIPRVQGISKEDFLREYFIPQKPVILEDLSQDWPARQKWDFDYFKQVAGDVVVPVYDGKPAKGQTEKSCSGEKAQIFRIYRYSKSRANRSKNVLF